MFRKILEIFQFNNFIHDLIIGAAKTTVCEFERTYNPGLITSIHCVITAWLCDKDDDCQDGTNGLQSSDERNCSFTCTNEQFKCLNGDCIPKSWKCDGTPDCDDASDETIACPPHQCVEELEFKCNNSGRCIPKVRRSKGNFSIFIIIVRLFFVNM